MTKYRTLESCVAASCSALMLATVLQTTPAEARNRNAAGIVGGIMGAAVVGAIISDTMKNTAKGMPQQPRQGTVKKRPTQKADDEEDEQKSAEAKAEEARVARANHLAKVEEERAMDRTRRLERQRNIDTAVNDFLSCLQILHTQLRSGNGQISGCTADAGRQLESRRSRGAAVADVKASAAAM